MSKSQAHSPKENTAELTLDSQMRIRSMPVGALIPYDKNPRINDAAIDVVADSIKAFGFKQPIVVDKNHTIVVGHTRFAAAIKLGFDRVPVLVADDLTEDQARAYRIMDNRAHEASEWDMDLLGSELEPIESAFPLEFFGFEELEVDREPVVEKWDFSQVFDKCAVTVTAPLHLQSEIRRRLRDLEGIEIEASHIQVD